MQTTQRLALLAMLVAVAASPVLAGSRSHGEHGERQRATQAHHNHSANHGMREVTNGAAAEQPGYGWRYFTDPVAQRAVAISPRGDYYLSRGKGLRWVTAASQPGA